MKKQSVQRSIFIYSVSMLFCFSVPAQTITSPSADQRYINRQHIIDSLSQQIAAMNLRLDSMQQIISDQRSVNQQQANANRTLADDNAKLQAAYTNAEGQKIQSSHTSSVLFIFNVLVGIFLLVALMWMFMRKKNPAVDAVTDIQLQPRMNGHALPLEHQIDQIEKLGSLREKGLLTDDEFNLQKRQILGEKH